MLSLMAATSLLCVLASCTTREYAPARVDPSPPPYQSKTEEGAVRNLLKSGVKVQDWRDDSTKGICPVHNFKMETILVPGLAGPIDPTEQYSKAAERYFPNHGIIYGSASYSRRVGRIYVCPKCITASRIWDEESD